MLVLIGFAAFLTVACAVLALGQRPMDPLEARLQALSGGGSQTARDGDATAQQFLRSTRVAIEAVGGGFANRLYARLERLQMVAGMVPDPGRFLIVWVTVAGSAILLGAVFLGVYGLAAGVLVGLLPYLWLRRNANTRRRRIARALPDAIDLIVACVEAGLALEAALVRVSEATEGPLAEEIRLTTGEIAIGRPRQEALLDLGTRTDVADLQSFLRPIVQAERAGTGVGVALRVQAAAMRERRRQRAKEKAERVPAKMVIPMAVFFLPALLIVVVAPAFLTLAKIFSGL